MKKVIVFISLFWIGWVQAEDADISVEVRLFQARVITGDLAKMEFTIRNQGPDTASAVRLDVNVTQGLFSQLTTSAPGPCQINQSAGQIRCENVGDFPAGSEKVVLVRVQLEQQEDPENLVLEANVSSPANDPNPGNNQQTAMFQVNALPTAGEYALSMLTNMPEARRARFARAAQVLGAYCGGDNLHNGINGLCDEILQQAELGDFEMLTRVLSWMRPRNAVHQARNSTKLVASQLSNLGARMAQLRAGVSGFSAADLNINNGSESLPLGMLAYQGEPAAESFVSPWGFFINGDLTTGDFEYADEVNDGFDFDSDSLTIGVDYRFSSRWVAGVALGYNEMDSDSGAGVRLQSKGFSANLYALFSPTEHFYWDTRFSYATPDIRQTRSEVFVLIDEVVETLAVGNTQSNQFTLSTQMGFNWYTGAWNWSPFLSVEYVNNELDQFTESGANGFNMFYAEQDFKAVKYDLGLTLSRAISTSKGVLSPQISWQHHVEDQDDGIMKMRLVGMPVDELFNVETNFTEDNYSQLGVGLTWVTANGKMFYLRYRQLLGLNNFDQSTISVGARFEF